MGHVAQDIVENVTGDLGVVLVATDEVRVET